MSEETKKCEVCGCYFETPSIGEKKLLKFAMEIEDTDGHHLAKMFWRWDVMCPKCYAGFGEAFSQWWFGSTGTTRFETVRS